MPGLTFFSYLPLLRSFHSSSCAMTCGREEGVAWDSAEQHAFNIRLVKPAMKV